MRVPGSPASAGCITTPNSKHCRTEFREVNPANGAAASWDPNRAVNRLRVTLAVAQLDNSGSGTIIGQVKIDDSVLTKPACELYYSLAGVLRMGVLQSHVGNQILTTAGTVPVGQTFTYEIRYEGNVLSVRINGAAPTVLSTYSLNAPRSYFKAGNYNQGSTPSTVYIFSMWVSHASTTLV